MSKKLPIVAIIGQTNAGKSALFNRLVGRQDAIVAREAGTTRDSVVRVVNGPSDVIARLQPKQSRNNSTGSRRSARDDSTRKPFLLVDTAGLKDPADDFEATIQDQVDDAIASADLILLVKDITEYPDQTDKNISKKALKSKKPVFLVLNKSDLKEKISPDEYLNLGIKDVFITSAEHNRGLASLAEGIAKSVSDTSRPAAANGADRTTGSPPKSGSPDLGMGMSSGSDRLDDAGVLERDLSNSLTSTLKIALIGRPNVGKSHLFNALAGKQQAIVAPVAGTTRDINRVAVRYHGQEIELLDTAGVRRPGKVEQGVEKFSVIRTVAAVEEADVCLLLIDAEDLNVSLDQKLAGMIAEAGKGLILVVSKWDLAGEEFAAETTLSTLKTNFDFAPWTPVVFTSSVTGQNVAKIFELATDIVKRRQQQLPTRKLNDTLQKAVAKHPPAGLKNTLPKMRYIVQTDINPPWFVIYGANFKHIHWSYKRYLERNLRENFDLAGTPIRFSFRDEKQIKANKSS
jgi:GTP-binding protein